MTGWRMGYAIVPESLVKTYGQLIINTISGVATFAQVGAVEALVGPQDDVDAMVVEFKARRDLIVDGLNAIPGHRVPQADRRVLRLPRHLGDGADRRRARRAAAPGGRRLRPGRVGVRRVRRRPHPDQLRELAGEPDRGARPDPDARRTARGGAGVSERPRVFVTRLIPDEGLAADQGRLRGGRLDRRPAATPRRAAPPGRRLRRGPDPADRPGGRRVPRRGRTRAQGRQQLRGRLRQHRCRGVRATRGRRRQHAGRPDRDDRGPGLGAPDGRGAGGCPRATATSAPADWKTWGPLLLLGPDVHGATIGIVGFGRIGQAVARRARGFGMGILYHDLQRLPDDVTRSARRDLPAARGAAAAERLRVAPRQPVRGDPRPDQRRRPWRR